MEQLTLEQAGSCYINEYSKNIPPTHSWHDSLSLSFKAGAEWQKEQYKLLCTLAFQAANVCDDEGAVDLCNEIKAELERLQD
jgi:hypothetical protein